MDSPSLCTVILAITLLANDSYGDGHGDTETTEDDSCTIQTLVTFNTGLVSSVPMYESRRTRTAEAIASIDADIVCLQEVYFEKDMLLLLETLGASYAYSWSFLHESIYTYWEAVKSRYLAPFFRVYGEKSFPCEDPAFPHLQQCILNNCAEANDSVSMLQCLNLECGGEGSALGQQCRSCVVIASSSLEKIVARCTTVAENRNRINVEGLVLLSKLPLDDVERIQMHPGIPQITPNGILKAKIKETTFGCTHLSADMGYRFPYYETGLTQVKNITSFRQEQKIEINKLRDVFPEEQTILTGDLNTGPAVASQDVDAELPDNYDMLMAQGFENPYVDLDARCTYCADNPVAVPLNAIIDYVLCRGVNCTGAYRILDDPSRVLSDHYGVTAWICI